MNTNSSVPDNQQLAIVLNDYYEDRCKLFPIEATQNGDNRYNDKLPVDFTDSYLDTLRGFYSGFLNKINQFNRDKLNKNDQISYDIFKREMEISREGVNLHFSVNTVTMPNIQYMPFNQFEGIPLFLGQMGSGTGIQPFKTVSDYDNWIKRASGFGAWTDSAIVYFRKGMANGYLLPGCLVVKMIPQMEAMVAADPTKSLFYGPANLIPDSFSAQDKARVTGDLVKLINETLTPAYKRLGDFLQNEYLPKSRTSIGFDDLPDGNKLYAYLIRYWTTTDKTPEEIYQTGLLEVKRIREEMELTKIKTGFSKDLLSFFTFMKTDPRFMPFKTPEEVLDAFRKIQKTIDPNLKKLFGHTPKLSVQPAPALNIIRVLPMVRVRAYSMYPFWMQPNSISPPAWNRSFCMKPFPAIIIRCLCRWKTPFFQNSEDLHGMAHMAKAGHFTANHWVKNWVCTRILINIWAH
jgi:uncharacterized protein (DUF885 family)